MICEPRVGLALTDMTCHELIDALAKSCWSWMALPSAIAKREALSYKIDEPKDWYSMSEHLHTNYLIALLRAEELLTPPTELVEIPHWSPTPGDAYVRILKKLRPKQQAIPALALENDVETGDAAGGPERMDLDVEAEDEEAMVDVPFGDLERELEIIMMDDPHLQEEHAVAAASGWGRRQRQGQQDSSGAS